MLRYIEVRSRTRTEFVDITEEVRELVKREVNIFTAIRAALSRSGPWAMSRRLAAQIGMTNKWLQDQGLISVKEQWVKIHYPAKAR